MVKLWEQGISETPTKLVAHSSMIGTRGSGGACISTGNLGRAASIMAFASGSKWIWTFAGRWIIDSDCAGTGTRGLELGSCVERRK